MRSVIAFAVLAGFCCTSTVLSDELVLRARKSGPGELIVLQTGRVVQGKLTPRQGGYDITLPTGRMFVASEQVRFRAATMDEAYQRMRDSVQDLSPETHMKLARWCLANKLTGKARREALDALHLDPYHTEARRLLEALVRHEKRTSAPAEVKPEEPMMPAPKRRSLGGLPVHLARDFTRYIQPIVVNKCGNSNCHSGGRNGLEIVSLRHGLNAWTSERNLAAILQHVDPQNPEDSPLLKATTGGHGNSRSPLFSGSTGRQQITKLREWVQGVSSELGASGQNGAPNESSTGSAGVQTASLEVTAQPHVPLTQTAPAIHTVNETLSNSDRETIAAQNDLRQLESANRASRVDRFSPSEFNRRYHGLTSDELAANSSRLPAAQNTADAISK